MHASQDIYKVPARITSDSEEPKIAQVLLRLDQAVPFIREVKNERLRKFKDDYKMAGVTGDTSKEKWMLRSDPKIIKTHCWRSKNV